jgi:transcription elongation factor GreA
MDKVPMTAAGHAALESELKRLVAVERPRIIELIAEATLIDEDTEEKKKYQIVGDAEADVKEGRISISSPIARALIGKSVGDTVEVTAPGGARSYEIVAVKFF